MKKINYLDYTTGLCFGLGIAAFVSRSSLEINMSMFGAIFMFLASALLGARFFIKK